MQDHQQKILILSPIVPYTYLRICFSNRILALNQSLHKIRISWFYIVKILFGGEKKWFHIFVNKRLYCANNAVIRSIFSGGCDLESLGFDKVLFVMIVRKILHRNFDSCLLRCACLLSNDSFIQKKKTRLAPLWQCPHFSGGILKKQRYFYG